MLEKREKKHLEYGLQDNPSMGKATKGIREVTTKTVFCQAHLNYTERWYRITSRSYSWANTSNLERGVASSPRGRSRRWCTSLLTRWWEGRRWCTSLLSRWWGVGQGFVGLNIIVLFGNGFIPRMKRAGSRPEEKHCEGSGFESRTFV